MTRCHNTMQGTASSKRKKAAKLKRVQNAVKKQVRKESRTSESFAAIQLLNDPQAHFFIYELDV